MSKKFKIQVVTVEDVIYVGNILDVSTSNKRDGQQDHIGLTGLTAQLWDFESDTDLMQ